MKRQIFICDCTNVEHQYSLTFFKEDSVIEDSELYLDIHLNKEYSIIRRIIYAIKYIFGYQCKYGAFDEIIINKETAEQTKLFIEEFLNDKEEEKA
jgi:hypothetical protein